MTRRKLETREAYLERQRENGRRWRANNLEKHREKSRAWGRAHPERVRERAQKWRLLNPERKRELARQWYKANPEKNKATWLRKAYNLTPKDKEQMLVYQHNACAICGRPAADF